MAIQTCVEEADRVDMEGTQEKILAPFRSTAVVKIEGSTRNELLLSCSHLDRCNRKAEIGFEQWTFRSQASPFNR
ncbi:hypothetical protein T265_07197 [Opisthorchis viverrini]|uniref:Uncharacterized protein n=1 Tax=Opisthorchis viverrini TaxID=6198 RepID=A0A074ZDE6_OPIVI|nr:hypothetical protein T265_07197 [Opisthorchis viverrini]KER25321.1 hypothetical protein T265_07197 [Opisthorchis viverrini]